MRDSEGGLFLVVVMCHMQFNFCGIYTYFADFTFFKFIVVVIVQYIYIQC